MQYSKRTQLSTSLQKVYKLTELLWMSLPPWIIRPVLAIYGPMVSTAPYVLLMRANTLRGQVRGGWALEIETFLVPVKWHRAVRREPFGTQKVEISRAQPTFVLLLYASLD